MRKRSINIAGHTTSVSLEDAFWDQLKLLAAEKTISINQLVARIDEQRDTQNLSSAIRLYVLEHLLSQLAALEGGVQ